MRILEIKISRIWLWCSI